MNTRRTGTTPASNHGTSLARQPTPSRSGRLAWVVLLLADTGIVLYGVLAVATPSLLTAGYERYSGTSWASLVAQAPQTAAYLLLIYRMVGGLNVALGITLIAIVVELKRIDALAPRVPPALTLPEKVPAMPPEAPP